MFEHDFVQLESISFEFKVVSQSKETSKKKGFGLYDSSLFCENRNYCYANLVEILDSVFITRV